jgi:tetratricopeptide (TPR) repeat protein
VNCSNCGAPYKTDETHCAICGVELPAHCQVCGIETPNGVEICINCRTDQVPAGVDAATMTAITFEVPEAVLPMGLDLKASFVGRSDLLEKLHEAFKRCREQRSFHFVAVVGKHGTGKSALVRRFREQLLQLETDTPLVLVGHAGGPGAPPFAAFIRILYSLFQIPENATSEMARQALLEGVGKVIPESRTAEVAHLVAHVMRIPFPGSPILEPLLATPAQLEMRVFIAVRRLLSALAERQPLVLVFDELERATPETVNLVHYLAAGLASEPVMAVLAGRPSMMDLHPRFGEGEFESLRIEVTPLEPPDAEALFHELLKSCEALPEELIEVVRSKVEATPRTLHELVRYLLEAGAIDAAKEPWDVDVQLIEKLAIPHSHEDMLRRRLASMAEGDRQVLERCAACGELFWLEAVVALIRSVSIGQGDPDGPSLEVIADTGERTHQSVTEALQRHVTRGFIVESETSRIRGQREFRFAYPPIWNLVYENIDAVDLSRYHQVVAQWLELRPEGRSAELQEEVARHLELAGDGTGAAMRYRRAADLARLMHYNDKAIRLYRQAISCLPDEDIGTRMHLWHDAGSVYELRGTYDEALAAFERMLRLSWVMNSRAKGGVAFNKMGRIHRQKGDLDIALQYLNRGILLFEQSGDERGIAGSLDDIGQVLWIQGRYDDALEKSSVSLEMRRRIGDERSIAVSLTNIGRIELDRGLVNEAAACHEEALAMRRSLDDKGGIIVSLNSLAVIEFVRGHLDRAVALWQESLGIAEEIGAIPLQAMLLNNLGEAAMAEGEVAGARQRLEEAVQLARLLDERRTLTDALRNLGLLELQEGHAEKAKALVEESLEVARSAGMREYQGRALLSLGEVHSSTLFDDTGADPTERARSYFAEAVEIFRELDNQAELAKTLSRYGDFLVERGNPDGGKILLEEAKILFQKLGMKDREKVTKRLEDVS